MQLKNIIKKVLIFLVFLSIPISIIINTNSKDYRIMRYGKFSITKITKVYKGFKASHFFDFEFLNEKKKKITCSSSLGLPFNGSFVNRYFFIVYNPHDPCENRVLITQSDYDDFGLTYPDSLNWVKDYLR